MSYNDRDLRDQAQHRALDPACLCDDCARMDGEDLYDDPDEDLYDELENDLDDSIPEGEQGTTDDEPDSIPF